VAAACACSEEHVNDAVRIAAVVHAAAMALES
jgi:hypothetical protein